MRFFIKIRTLALLSFKGQATKRTTVKWSIQQANEIFFFCSSLRYSTILCSAVRGTIFILCKAILALYIKQSILAPLEELFHYLKKKRLHLATA